MTSEEFDLIDNADVRKFICEHKDENPRSFALKFSGKKDYPFRAIAEQIKCYQKAKVKLPKLSNLDFIFESIALEQASSEAAAKYKTDLINGEKIIDLTGGLGIDSIHFADKFKKVIYCEKNDLLCNIFKRNIETLGLTNVEVTEGDGTEIIKDFPDKYFDWIYVDPSRRDLQKRLVGLENCVPNVISNIDLFFEKSKNILIKVSPAIDFSKVKEQLPALSRFIAVSVDGECKEILLVIAGRENLNKTLIEASILDEKGKSFSHITKCENELIGKKVLNEVKKYLYEPDAAIIKTVLSSKLAEQKALFFINSSVDYLTSEYLISDFPGRIFKVVFNSTYSKKNVKEYLKKNEISSANIARRDFPDSPEQIKENLKLKDGGRDYFFFTRNNLNVYIFIHCIKPEK